MGVEWAGFQVGPVGGTQTVRFSDAAAVETRRRGARLPRLSDWHAADPRRAPQPKSASQLASFKYQFRHRASCFVATFHLARLGQPWRQLALPLQGRRCGDDSDVWGWVTVGAVEGTDDSERVHACG